MRWMSRMVEMFPSSVGAQRHALFQLLLFDFELDLRSVPLLWAAGERHLNRLADPSSVPAQQLRALDLELRQLPLCPQRSAVWLLVQLDQVADNYELRVARRFSCESRRTGRSTAPSPSGPCAVRRCPTELLSLDEPLELIVNLCQMNRRNTTTSECEMEGANHHVWCLRRSQKFNL